MKRNPNEFDIQPGTMSRGRAMNIWMNGVTNETPIIVKGNKVVEGKDLVKAAIVLGYEKIMVNDMEANYDRFGSDHYIALIAAMTDNEKVNKGMPTQVWTDLFNEGLLTKSKQLTPYGKVIVKDCIVNWIKSLNLPSELNNARTIHGKRATAGTTGSS